MTLQKLEWKQFLPITQQQAWDFFSTPGNLAVITPRRLNFRILSISGDGSIHRGQIIKYRITILPLIRIYWETEITEVIPLKSFTDVQLKGPYSRWAHRHNFIQHEGGIEMTDELEYAIPGGLLGNLANFLFVRREVRRIFDYRFHALNNHFRKTS